MKLIKSYIKEDIYYVYKAYCQDRGTSLSAMAGKLIEAELCRRGRIDTKQGKVWVNVSDIPKDHSL
jgi:hypothetical protein